MCPKRIATVVLAAVVLGTPIPAAGQEKEPAAQEKEKQRPRGLLWRNRPSIQIGDDIRIDLRLKLQFDGRGFDPVIDEDAYDWRVRRWGINGEIGNHIEFQIERDFQKDGKWRDLFVNWRTFRQFSVMAGRFKVPFGREELIGISDVDFAFRTLASTTIPPARDKGVMVHGRFFQRALTYEIGAFEEDGDNARLQEPQFSVSGDPPGLGPSYAGRVTVLPLRALTEKLETLRIGAAYGTVDVPEGLNSLRGVSVYGTEEFFPPVFVKGRRQRIGTEISFTPGPVGLVAEWMQSREERRNQGLRNIDLSDVLATGWYTSVTWLVTGEDKDGFNNPRRSLFKGGFGAVEVGARYERLQFESESKVGTPFRNSRADHILGNSDSVWTFGVNWFPNRWVRLVANGIHETFDDPGTAAVPRTPIQGTTEFWSSVFRLQIVF
jgi:phosphate-selective porin OprO/OprP